HLRAAEAKAVAAGTADRAEAASGAHGTIASPDASSNEPGAPVRTLMDRLLAPAKTMVNAQVSSLRAEIAAANALVEEHKARASALHAEIHVDDVLLDEYRDRIAEMEGHAQDLEDRIATAASENRMLRDFRHELLAAVGNLYSEVVAYR